ncbi:MAG: hypothetical protein WC975_12150 [Phycisphaerae bacterium]
MDLNSIIQAVQRGKDWLLRDQITEATKTYDMLDWEKGDDEPWHEIPTPTYLVGAYYANLVRNDPRAVRANEVRRQYYNTWHTAQAGVALLEYLDYDDDPAVRNSVDLAWRFIDRQQIKEGPFKGVFVEAGPEKLKFPLEDRFSFGHTSAYAVNSYASYDNIETDLFPLELYRRTKDERYLKVACDNAVFFLEHKPQYVFMQVETKNFSISGMTNDAVYGRLAEYTGEPRFLDTFIKQIQRLNELGLDLRAQNNIRNMYWDASALMYAVDQVPQMFGLAMAKLAFLAEHTLFAQKESGVLWFRYKSPGVPDGDHERTQDGAATYAMIRVWGKMYDQTGDRRWLNAIRKAVGFALTQQYPDDYGPEFAGAFEYAGVVEYKGHKYESLRDISTIFALRGLLPLLTGECKWVEDFWKCP